MSNYNQGGLPEIDITAVLRFLEAFAGKNAPFTFQTFDDSPQKRPELACVRHGTLQPLAQILARLNQQRAGVFFTVNQTDGNGRKRENITRVRALFVDLDGSPLEPVTRLSAHLQPHIVIESSPGKWHAYWLVSDCPLEQFKPLQQALAQRFNGDKSVCDLPRVMRLPGFLHQKGEPVLTRIHYMADDLTPYTLAQLASITAPPVQPEQPKPKATQQPIRTTATATGFEAVKRAAQGQWTAILGRLGIHLPPHKHHAPCPACGGKDRFRFDDLEGHGTFICNQGGNGLLTGDGFSLVQHVKQCSAEEALKRVRDIVMPSTDKMTDNKKAAPPSEEDAAPETQTSGDSVAGGESEGEEDAAPETQTSGDSVAGTDEEWLEPDPIVASQEGDDYPLESLPAPLLKVVEEVVGYLQCPVALAANAILAALSLSIQGLVNVARDDVLTAPVSLFLMAIAESGERKSACDDMIIKCVKSLNAKRFCQDAEKNTVFQSDFQIWNAKKEGIIAALKQAAKTGESTNDCSEQIKALDLEKPQEPRGTTFLYEDATVEALLKGLYKNSPSGGIFSSEAGVVFGGHGMNKDNAMRNMASLNTLWDGADIIVDRMDFSKNMLLTGRRLTLCLATQESTVRAFFDNSKGLARGTGFGARFLIAWPKSTQGTRFYKPRPLLLNQANFSNRIIELLNTELDTVPETGALRPHTLHFSDNAKEEWIRFYNDTERELRTGGELQEIKDVTSKAADNVARIAALFHVYEHGTTGLISEEHVISAGRIMAWHLMESKRFFSEVALPKELHRATVLDAWLIRQCKESGSNQISLMQTRQKCPNSLREKGVIDDILNHLVELNRVRIVKDGKKKQIHLNPKLLEV